MKIIQITLILCSTLILILQAQQCSKNCSLECTPRSTCKEIKSNSLRILFDTSRNIHIFCKHFKIYSTEAFPVFDIPNLKSLNDEAGLNLPTMINKCYNSRPKHIKYNFKLLSRDPINITGDTFAKTQKLETLKLVSWNENTYLALRDSFLTNLTDLKHLTLERANIKEANIFFRDTVGLTDLKIVINHIEELPEKAFKYLTNLEKLEFYENSLKHIKPGAFYGLESLHTLDLARNLLTDLSEKVFDELTELRNLDLNRNNIKLIPKDVFQKTKKLEFLDLSSNSNFEITEPIFTHLPKLKYLNLSFCQITEITEDTFKGAENLEHINLSYNKIKRIDANSFRQLTSLQYLNISGNRIQTFDLEIYENIKTLKLLDLAFNQIKVIERLPNNELLEKLNLRGNIIDRIPELSAGNGSLKSLDIGFNLLKGTLKLKRDYPKSGIFDLNLVRNKYTEIEWSEPEQNISAHNGITSINFQENHLSCDCQKHVIEKCFHYPDCPQSTWMQLDINKDKINCIWNEYPDNAEIYQVSCPIINVYGTPKDCKFEFKENKKGNLEPSFVLDCSFKNLTKLPELKNFKFGDTSFAKEIILLLNGNKLKSFLKKDMDAGYKHVTNLNLSNNHIEQFDGVPNNVQIVDLSNNYLTNLDDKVLLDFDKKHRLNKIILNNNPWNCDCDSQNLKEYLINNTNLKVNKSDVYCVSTGTDLVLSHICGENRIKIILPVTVAIIFAFISVLMALYYRYRTPIKVWLFSKNMLMWWVAKEDFDKDKTYDVFVSYSYKDEDFVQNHLLPEMEKPERPYKVCVHYRDWLPGEFISQQITKSVLDSRRTLVVLSNNFMESVWGKMEFRTAHTQAISENKIRVIVVIFGELDETNLDEEMKAYLKTNTYVKWGDPWFWNKLRYALPHSRGIPKEEIPITAGKTGHFICCNWFNRFTHISYNDAENINMRVVPEI